LNGQTVSLTGWIAKKAKKVSKSLAFGVLRDSDGSLMQLVGEGELAKKLRSVSTESAVIVSGRLQPKQGTKNDSELVLEQVQVVNPATVRASHLTDGTKTWQAQYRYMQLREPVFQQRLRNRALVNRICRENLDKSGFTEIETPLLFKSTPEGAKEFLVPTRTQGSCYALPQSPTAGVYSA
jgi:aspartyl-tRNA synthetase